jgi:hypothetical protein
MYLVHSKTGVNKKNVVMENYINPVLENEVSKLLPLIYVTLTPAVNICNKLYRFCRIKKKISILQGQRVFTLSSVSRPALGLTQPPEQWVTGSFPRGKARPGRDADHSPLSSAEVNNE